MSSHSITLRQHPSENAENGNALPHLSSSLCLNSITPYPYLNVNLALAQSLLSTTHFPPPRLVIERRVWKQRIDTRLSSLLKIFNLGEGWTLGLVWKDYWLRRGDRKGIDGATRAFSQYSRSDQLWAHLHVVQQCLGIKARGGPRRHFVAY